MNIGQAAASSGVSAKMIRYYEIIGLLPKVGRNANGYRRYTDVEMHTLRFIGRARRLGFPIEQVRRLLALWRNPRRASGDVKRIAQAHVAELQHKIAELQSIVQALQHLAGHCHGDHRPECPILDGLLERDPPRPRVRQRPAALRAGAAALRRGDRP